MKQLTCEMCGSTELIKDGGFFVCQTCGTKYSVEEAKKMMIEGTVDVQGTVKVDDSASIENYLQNARRARDKGDWKEAEKYYNLVEQTSPTNIEALFFSAFATYEMSVLENSPVQLQLHNHKILEKDTLLIAEYDDVNKSEENKQVILKISEVINSTRNDIFKCQWIEVFFAKALEEIIKKDEQEYLCRLLYGYYTNVIVYGAFRDKNATKDFPEKRELLSQKIKKFDPSFDYNRAIKKGGCYVATCVYGSYDCPQVWTLRRYRDDTLGSTWYGRLFIRTYYAISPTLVKWFGNMNWFKKLWKGKLDRMVAKLQNNGVEDTPYEDKEW